ncbi:MAG: hypothetical protein SGARI_006908 [Bacillariaceae sp.]
MVWPSAGGDEVQPKNSALEASPRSMSYAAFYTDCPHEVKPLESGSRCVLVFGLYVPLNSAPIPTTPSLANAAGSSLLLSYMKQFQEEKNAGKTTKEATNSLYLYVQWCREIFGSKKKENGTDGSPQKIVIPLQHMYTRQMLSSSHAAEGLHWLKGPDVNIFKLVKGCAESKYFAARIHLVNPDGRTPLKTDSKHNVPFLECEDGPLPIYEQEFLFGTDRNWKTGVRRLSSYSGETHNERYSRNDRRQKTYQRAVLILWPASEHEQVLKTFKTYKEALVEEPELARCIDESRYLWED